MIALSHHVRLKDQLVREGRWDDTPESEAAARLQWSDARRETRKLETDRDRAHEQWAEAWRREEALEMDEIASRQHPRQPENLS